MPVVARTPTTIAAASSIDRSRWGDNETGPNARIAERATRQLLFPEGRPLRATGHSPPTGLADGFGMGSPPTAGRGFTPPGARGSPARTDDSAVCPGSPGVGNRRPDDDFITLGKRGRGAQAEWASTTGRIVRVASCYTTTPLE